jgi:hypothetical protein
MQSLGKRVFIHHWQIARRIVGRSFALSNCLGRNDLRTFSSSTR